MFGPGESDELVLVHRGILEEIEARVQTMPRGKRLFPFNHVVVRLASEDEPKRSLYRAAFAQDGRLEKDIRQALDTAGVEYAKGLVIEIDAAEGDGRAFELECELREALPPVPAAGLEAQTGNARLVVLRGKARESEYTLVRRKTLVGRMQELTDNDHRVIRRNDIIFEDGADDANATVSRRHASVRHDAATGEYRICDDGSEYGTRIFRDGRPIEVPLGNRRGERLRSGDEVYFGRACLRFEQS